jgi:hypothetical protein
MNLACLLYLVCLVDLVMSYPFPPKAVLGKWLKVPLLVGWPFRQVPQIHIVKMDSLGLYPFCLKAILGKNLLSLQDTPLPAPGQARFLYHPFLELCQADCV